VLQIRNTCNNIKRKKTALVEGTCPLFFAW
jgi:hypothetical protein